MLSTSCFQHFILHHFTTGIIFWGLASVPCCCYEVRYPKRFKTATSSGRNIQIASKSVRTYRRPVTIDVFSSLICALSVTEIQLCKVNAHFPLDCTIISLVPRPSYTAAEGLHHRYECISGWGRDYTIIACKLESLVPFSQSTINFDNYFVPPISPSTVFVSLRQ